jgi:cytochrome o ubiquinol oxidase subunit 3
MNHAITHEEHHHDTNGTDVFGFWLYILTDCILFGSIFATFVVMNKPDAYGPALKQFIELPYVLKETFFLLASNFTFGLAMLSMYKRKLLGMRFWLFLTFLLGFGFVYMEVSEFILLFHEGFTPATSGLASAFFTLVGTHGLHVSCGLIWILFMIIQAGIFRNNHDWLEKRMVMLGIFWNFLDIVWIFVFTVVYLTGAL